MMQSPNWFRFDSTVVQGVVVRVVLPGVVVPLGLVVLLPSRFINIHYLKTDVLVSLN